MEIEPEVIKRIVSEASCVIGLWIVCTTVGVLYFIKRYFKNGDE